MQSTACRGGPESIDLGGVIEQLVSSGKAPPWTMRFSPAWEDEAGPVRLVTTNMIVRDLASAAPGALKAIEKAISAAAGRPVAVVVEHEPASPDDVPPPDAADAAESAEGPRGPESRPAPPLDEIVVDEFNAAACWAIGRVVAGEPPGVPVVIHGGQGLGKTLLLRDAASRLGHGVEHVTAEDFANQFIAAAAEREFAAFRARFREAKALIVDDVHFLADKPRMQDELVRAIESVALRGGAVLLSSLAMPSPSCGMSERLTSWIRGGFPAGLDRPGPAAMARIVSAKAAARGLSLQADVAAMVAANFRRSIREAEGAVNRLAAAALVGGAVDAAGAATALADMLSLSKRILVPIEEVAEAASARFGVTVAAIQGPSRKKRDAAARQTFLWLALRLTGQSLAGIGRWCGGRDHSTVIYSVRRVESNPAAKAEAESLEEMLRHVPSAGRVKTGRAQVVYRS